MKLKNLIMAVLATGAVVMSCQQEKPVFGISADKETIEFPQGGGTAQVQVTTAQAWTVKIPSDAKDWLTADPASGTGNATITFTATANTGKDRKTGLKVNAGMAGYVSVAVSQPGSQVPGDGLTAATAWSASEANAWVKANLADKQVTTEKYYIKGIIHKVQTTFAASGTYGNAIFFISDDGQAASDDFEAFQVYYLGGRQWKTGDTEVKVGDEVILYGPVTLYGSTAETSGKGAAYIYSLNGVTEGGNGGGEDETDYSKAEAKTVAEFIAAADKNTYYKLTGTVSGFNAQYCSFDLTDATGSIYVYSVLDAYKSEWSSKIQNGGTVVIAGKYEFYEKKSQHEVVNAAILSFEGGQSTTEDDPKGTGTLEDPYNAAAANAAALALAQNAKSDSDVYVKGKISSIKYTFSADFGTATFNISDDGTTTGSQFTCYSVYYLGNRAWVDGDAQVAVGDEVVIYGKLYNYNGNTPETASKEAYIYSLNGQTSIGSTPTFGVKHADISVAATATEAVISVTGNVAWTASSADATLDVTSGEGAGDIKASFAANTDTENAKTYKVTLTTTADVDNKTIEVIITQGKAASGNAVTVSVDFRAENPDLPQGSANKKQDGTYTLGGQTFVLHAADGFYQAKSNDLYYLLIGKKDSYVELPVIEGKALTSVKFLTGPNASENVIIDLAKQDGTLLGINTEKNKKGKEYDYTLTGEVGAAYRIWVTNAYNAQFQTLTLTYE